MSSILSWPIENDRISAVVHDLATHGYAVSDMVLPPPVTQEVFKAAVATDPDSYAPAGIGREQEHGMNPFVRGNAIRWISGKQPAFRNYLAWMEDLRLAINQRLFLGLFEYECHLARYPVGRFYRAHLDAFKGESNRVLSTVLYLNPQWHAGDGGELVLYGPDWKTELTRVAPVLGRLVLFLSEEFPHEVLPTRRLRYSLTGWFRVNQSTAVKADPPR